MWSTKFLILTQLLGVEKAGWLASEMHEQFQGVSLMQSENSSEYIPAWKDGTRVRLSLTDHRKSGQGATIVAALPNPSKRREHQWYDVRFDDFVYGRFLEKHLERISMVSEEQVA